MNAATAAAFLAKAGSRHVVDQVAADHDRVRPGGGDLVRQPVEERHVAADVEVREVGHPHLGDRQVDPHVVAEQQEAGLDPAGVDQPQQQSEEGAGDDPPLEDPPQAGRMRWTRIRLVRGRSRTGCPMRMMMRSPGTTSFAARSSRSTT